MDIRNPALPLKTALLLSIILIAGCAQPQAEPMAPAPAERKVIASDGAPPAIGPYSQAIQVGDMLFLAGQVGLDPTTRTLVEGGIEAQTHRAMDNLKAVLEEAGFTMADVVQAQVFLADLNDYAAMNEVYGSYFATMPPGRAAVQVARLPLDARVEIMMTAVKGH